MKYEKPLDTPKRCDNNYVLYCYTATAKRRKVLEDELRRRKNVKGPTGPALYPRSRLFNCRRVWRQQRYRIRHYH